MEIRLADGTGVRLRAIRGDDKALLADAHARLSEETRRRRFLAPKPRLTGTELRYLTEVDGHDHFALVAALPGDGGEVIAVARFVRLPDRRDTGDFAIVVSDEYQGRGLGRALARALADAALERGVTRFVATTLSDNVAARRLMRTIAARLVPAPASGGVGDVVAELAA